jgi:hypothetical protein
MGTEYKKWKTTNSIQALHIRQRKSIRTILSLKFYRIFYETITKIRFSFCNFVMFNKKKYFALPKNFAYLYLLPQILVNTCFNFNYLDCFVLHQT